MSGGGGKHPLAVAAWMLVAAILIGGSVAVISGILSPSIVVDLVAMWPAFVAVLLVGIGFWIRGRKKNARASAIVPLALFSILVFLSSVHIGGWDRLPSAEARLTGPAVDTLSAETAFQVQLDGDLGITAGGSDAAYRVIPILRGGTVGIPTAVETSVDGDVTVELSSDDGPGWYRFSGWDVELAPAIVWRLVVNGRTDANLAALRVGSLAIAGSGVVRLGAPEPGGSDVVVSGDFDVSVPNGVAVDVTGNATVPDGWTTDGDGSHAPVDSDDGWRIRIDGDTPVSITER